MLNIIKQPSFPVLAFTGEYLVGYGLFGAKRSIRRAALAGLAMAALVLASGAACAAQGGTASVVDPIRTDVDISGPFLQRTSRDPHDPMFADRCGEPEITQDALHQNILVVSCMSTAGLNYQTPRPWKNFSKINVTKNGAWYEPCYTFISHDGGDSWRRVLPDPALSPKLFTECSDPLAQRGPHGELYLGGDAFHYPVQGKFAPVLLLPGGSFPLEGLGIAFTRSLDGGNTWSKAIIIPTATDRPFWAVDQSTGVIYSVSGCLDVTTIGAYGCTPTSRNLATSTDHGLTWTPSVTVFSKDPPTAELTSHRLHNIAFGSSLYNIANPIAAAQGVFATAGISADGTHLLFKYSTDQGVTFTQHVTPIGGSAPCRPPLFWGQMAADPAHRGTFAAIVLCGPIPRAVRILVTHDLGASWTETSLAVAPPPGYAGNPSVRIPSPPSAGTDMSTLVLEIPNSNFEVNRPWAAYGPTGALGVLWRQDYYGVAPGAQASKLPLADAIRPGPQDIYVAISTDGGTKFGRPTRVNTAASPPPDPRGGNDDTSQIMLDRHYAYAVWGDWRSGELQSWFRKVPIPRH